MDKVQELISKMTKDYKSLLEVSEAEMNKNIPLLEKEGKSAHAKFINDTIANAKNGNSQDINKIMETFNNLK